MAAWLGKSATATIDPLLLRWGLKPRDVSERGLDVLRAMEAERADLAEKLQIAETLAVRDALTGALNRRGFLGALHRTMAEYERYATPAAVLYFDLDGFKAVNDGFGHAAGDAVLCQVARVLIDNVRETDCVGRIGGDEFGVILDHAQPMEARVKADILLAKLNAEPVRHAGVAHHVRASVGLHPIAVVEAPEIALARADEAMYADKRRKRMQDRRAAAAV
jgi:diguanylate cyclase (GGDEF)-like protein